MGASAREIEQEIKETRERMEQNLSVLENHAASGAVRYAKIAAVGIGATAAAVAAFLIYRRLRRPTVKATVSETSRPRTVASIVRKVAPAVIGTASTALLRRFIRRAASQAD